MDSEAKELLRRNIAISEENNKILRGLRRTARWGTAVRVLYWTLIVGVSVGAFYYIQPYAEQALSTYKAASEQLQSVGSSVQKLNQYLPK